MLPDSCAATQRAAARETDGLFHQDSEIQQRVQAGLDAGPAKSRRIFAPITSSAAGPPTT